MTVAFVVALANAFIMIVFFGVFIIFDAAAIVFYGATAGKFLNVVGVGATAFVVVITIAFVAVINTISVFHYLFSLIKKVADLSVSNINNLKVNLNIFYFNNVKSFWSRRSLKFGNIADFLANQSFGQRR